MKHWPSLPKKVRGSGGLITVVEVDQPKGDDGSHSDGTWEPEGRLISMKQNLEQRYKWIIFEHELAHAMLCDSGLVNLLTDAMQEALADAIGTARVVEMEGNPR